MAPTRNAPGPAFAMWAGRRARPFMSVADGARRLDLLGARAVAQVQRPGRDGPGGRVLERGQQLLLERVGRVVAGHQRGEEWADRDRVALDAVAAAEAVAT